MVTTLCHLVFLLQLVGVISFSFVVGGNTSFVVGGDVSCVVGGDNFCSLNSLGTGINKQYEGLPECGMIIKVE